MTNQHWLAVRRRKPIEEISELKERWEAKKFSERLSLESFEREEIKKNLLSIFRLLLPVFRPFYILVSLVRSFANFLLASNKNCSSSSAISISCSYCFLFQQQLQQKYHHMVLFYPLKSPLRNFAPTFQLSKAHLIGRHDANEPIIFSFIHYESFI